MARPQRKNAEYFSHDYNALTDEKILEMRADYGIAGYGMFWGIVEQLAQATDNKLSLSAIGGLSLLLGVAKAELSEFLSDAINKYGLFDSDGTMYWSESLNRRIELRQNASQSYSEAGKKGAAKRWANKTISSPEHGLPMQNDSHATENDSQVIQNDSQANSPPIAFDSNKRKVKESKGKNKDLRERERAGEPECADEPDNGDEHPPPIPSFRRPEWRLLATRRTVDLDELMQDFVIAMDRIPREFVELWWLHYESTNWLDGTGKVVEAAEKIRLKWRNGKERPQQQFSQSHGNSNSTAINGIRPTPNKYGDL